MTARLKLAYVNPDQSDLTREMEQERARYLGSGRCYECDKFVIEAGGTLAGMLICAECADGWCRDAEGIESTEAT